MSSIERPYTRGIYLIVLNSEDPSPLLPESDEEEVKKEEKPKESKKEDKGKEKETKEPSLNRKMILIKNEKNYGFANGNNFVITYFSQSNFF